MPELRWTLLIIGVLFVVILAWWERRRPHQASRQAPHISGDPRPVVGNDPSWGPETESPNQRVIREPLILPEIRTEARVRESPRELPIVEIPDESVIGLRADGRAEDVRAREAIAEEFEGEAIAEDLEGGAIAEELEGEPIAEEPEDEESRVAPAPPAPESGPSRTGSERAPQLPPPVAANVPPIVDWPPEEQRKLLSLRLVARPPERFKGHLVRQALAAEGFVLGELDIFHKPDSNNRTVLSAASLTKPGTFDLQTMDTQRYVGLNLFAVLPGPRSPQKAFEELLMTARMLNERLEGALQDERGGPLTPTRIQILRDALGAEANS